MCRILTITVAALLAAVLPGPPAAGQAAKLTPTEAAIVAAGAAVLSGRKAVPSVVFGDAAVQTLEKARFRDPSFALHRFQLIARDPHPIWPNTTTLGTYLQFVGSAGRRFRMTFIADYTQTGRSVMVHHAEVLPSYAPAIAVRPLFAVVPSEKLHLELLSEDTTFDILAEFAERNAVRLDPAGRQPPAPGNYYAFAFFTERLRDDERIALQTSASPKSYEGSPLRAWHLDQEGWRVVVAPVHVGEKNTASTFLKAIVTSKGKDETVTKRMAGVLRLSGHAK